jgi:predicted NBD/HSP70 family sugar kinase
MDRRLMREINQNTLLNLIRAHAPVSRAELKRLSGLSLGTIVGITTALMEQQLVVETGVAESTGGRKAGLLEIAPEGGYVIGIDLREQIVTGVVLNLHGTAVYQESWITTLRNRAAQAVDMIGDGVGDFIERAGLPGSKIIGLGCGISGSVNVQTGMSVDSWILGWHNVDLGEPLSERLGMPVFVDNAVNCLASYEKLYGHGRTYHDFLLVTIGRGLGLAISIGDRLFRGAYGLGAEFGHIPFEINGRICECGKQGCLEAYIADHGLLATYYECTTNSTRVKAGEVGMREVDDLHRRALGGDQSAQHAFELTGARLGTGLATLVNLFNPQCIVLNVGMGRRGDLLLEPMQAALKTHVFSQLGRNLELIVERETMQINWARGAACLVLRDFFSSPV